jgi:hypothetical protein
MSRKKPTYADIDWYLISIDRLRKGGLILVALLAVAAAAWWFFYGQTPRERARRAISEAEVALNQLASVDDFRSVKPDFDRSNVRLIEGRSLYQGGNWNGALRAASDAANIATLALTRVPGAGQFDAQFITIEGDVQLQKGASGDWRRARVRDLLFNGDWVKTTSGSSAELIFADGSLYTIGPDALLEIYAAVNPQTSRRQNTVQMQVGLVEINTADDSSTVRTPGTQVTISSDSTTQVGVGASRETAVTSLRGSASVASIGGGSAVSLASGQAVEAGAEGGLSEVRNVISPPILVSPADNQVFQAGRDRSVALSWQPLPEAGSYRLQVSRSRLFSSLEIDARRAGTSATTRVTDQGAFYWRVATVDRDGRRGPFSPFRRFRVVGGIGTGSPGTSDKTPPILDLKPPFRIGGQYYMLEGKVEPGASVFFDDEEIAVETDGSFRKLVSFNKVGRNAVVVRAVDPSGNQTIRRENVYVEE